MLAVLAHWSNGRTSQFTGEAVYMQHRRHNIHRINSLRSLRTQAVGILHTDILHGRTRMLKRTPVELTETEYASTICICLGGTNDFGILFREYCRVVHVVHVLHSERSACANLHCMSTASPTMRHTVTIRTETVSTESAYIGT